jgi:hypothetical protein
LVGFALWLGEAIDDRRLVVVGCVRGLVDPVLGVPAAWDLSGR